MPLHDAVGINCKKGATTEYQGAEVKYMGQGCIFMIMCVLSDLTWLPLLGGGRKSWYIIIIIIIIVIIIIIIISLIALPNQQSQSQESEKTRSI